MLIRSMMSCLAAGLALGVALPPLSQVWLPFLALPLFVVKLAKADCGRRAFLFGTSFGLGYFGMAFHWIGAAFFVDAETNLWMMPFAVGGLSLFMALYWGLASWAAWATSQKGLPLWLATPAFLSLAEWLRGQLFTGFPWSVPGLMAVVIEPLLQAASVIGMTGLTLMVLLWSAAPAALLARAPQKHSEKLLAALLLLLLPAVLGLGSVRLAMNPTLLDEAKSVRLVQPNISQDDKWRSDNASTIFASLKQLSAMPSGTPPNLIVWPESAVPFLLDEDQQALAQIGDLLDAKQVLLTGAIRRRGDATGSEQYFTSVHMINTEGAISGTYDKWRLVPGGEYLPFENLLTPLGFRKVVNLPESFTPGSGPLSFAVPGFGLATPLICYEVIFPHHLLPDQRPDFIVNVTNDGWFGKSVGPYQHAAQVRMRAVEYGLPVIRAANTGISMVTDPLGRVVAFSLLDQETIVDSALPQALGLTVYSRFGDMAYFFILVATFILGLVVRGRNFQPEFLIAVS